MATTTNLRFDISSGWDGAGVDDARAQLEALKGQIDELSSKQIKIQADTTAAKAELDSLQRELEQLSNEDTRMKLGIDDAQAKAAIDEIKARMQTLQDKIVRLNLDDADAKLKMEAFKAEEDRLSDKTIKLKADTSQADKAIADSTAKTKAAMNDATQAWAKSSFAMQRASLNLFSALAMLAPAIVPLGAAVLGASGAIVSGFGSAGIAAGIFGLSLKSTLTSAMGIYTQTNQLNQTLAAQKQTLAGLTPGSAAYNSQLIAIRSTQSQLNATMAQGTPVQQQIAKSLLDLKSAWQSMQQQAEKFTGPLILNGLNGIKASLAFLPPVIKAVSGVFAPLVAQFDHFATGGGMQKFVAWVISVGVPNLKNLIDTIQHIGITIVQIGSQFSTSGASVTKWLDDVTEKLDRWGANGGFTRFQATITAMWPKLKQFFEDLGLAIQHIIVALDQLGPLSFSMIGLIAKAAAGLPIPALQAFFLAFAGYKVIAAASGAVLGLKATVESANAAFAVGQEALAGFKKGLEGTSVAAKDSTVGMVASKVAILAQAAASRVASAAQAVWTAVTNAWKAATEGATLASIGQKIAAIASAVADGVATAAQAAWDAAIGVFEALTAPITIVILAIVAGVAALGFAIYELVDHWTTVWHTIEEVAKEVWGFLTQGWGQFLLLFLGPLGPIIEVAAHWKEIWDGIKIAALAVWDALQAAWRDTVAFLKSAWDAVWGALKSTWDTVWNGIKQVAEDIWNGLQAAWSNFLSAVKSVWDTISGAFKSAWNDVWTTAKQIAEDVWTALQSAWEAFLTFFKSLWDTISGAFKSAWDTLWNDAKQLATDVWTALRSAWDDLMTFFKSLWDTISGAIKSAWDTFWTALKVTATDVWDALKQGWNDIVSSFKSVWDTISGALKSAWSDAWTSMKKTATDIWDALKTAFATPINFIIGCWDVVADVIGVGKVNPIAGQPGYFTLAEGGQVPSHVGPGLVNGPGGPTEDRVPGWLSNQEFVMNADATSRIGANNLAAWNAGKTPEFGLAAGGSINRSPGFRLAGGDTGPGQTANTVQGNSPTNHTGSLTQTQSVNAFTAQNNIIAAQEAQDGSFWHQLVGGVESLVATVVYDSMKPVLDGIVSGVPDPFPGFPGGHGDNSLGHIPKAAAQKAVNSVLAKLKSAEDAAKTAAAAVGGQIPQGQKLAIIDAALSADGIPQSQWPQWEAGLNTLITRESSWNAGAVNNVDSNAAAGTPSEGLAQVIAPTFAAFRNPALPDNLLDPTANVAAAINYINATYGGIGNVQQANANLPPKGYDIGGVLGTGYTLAYNATGVPEGVLNPTGLAAIGGFSGLGALNAGTYTYTGGGGGGLDGSGQPVVVNVSNVWNGNPDKDAVQYAEHDMAEELTQAVIAGIGARTT